MSSPDASQAPLTQHAIPELIVLQTCPPSLAAHHPPSCPSQTLQLFLDFFFSLSPPTSPLPGTVGLILSPFMLLFISHLGHSCLLNTHHFPILRALRFHRRASGTIVGLKGGHIGMTPDPGLLLLPEQLCFYLFDFIKIPLKI